MTTGSETSSRRERWLEIAAYTAAGLVPLAIILLLVRVWEYGIGMPFAYGSDTLLTGAIIKGVLRNGWWLGNPALGAPGVMNLYEMPGADTLTYLAVRALGLFSSDWATVTNLYYLLGYPAAGLTAVFALRRLGMSRVSATCGAVIFALTPYHWMRGEGHLFLSSYAVVPLLVLVAFWMSSERVPLLGAKTDGAPAWDLRSPRSLGALGVCVAGAMCGVYYAFFGAFLIVLASARAAFASRERRIALAGLALAGVIGLVAVAQAVPNILLAAKEGPNPAGMARNPDQSEVYGLKITQLFLPADGHRIAVFAKLKAAYRARLRQMGPYLDNEANTSSLGVLGALGFLVSLLAFAFTRARAPDDVLRGAGFLNLGSLLLATVGGFGAMIAVVLPQIRGYNRISVFIAFVSVVALAALADRPLAKWSRGTARTAAVALLLGLTVLAVLDQTPPTLTVPAAQADAYRADGAFASSVASSLPKGAEVFQVPYMQFPEPGGPLFGMQDYDPLRPYLHADGPHWSYGAMKGRADAEWQKATAALPAPELVRELRARSFAALWVQSSGYEDGGSAIRAALARELGAPPTTSADGTFAVWRL